MEGLLRKHINDCISLWVAATTKTPLLTWTGWRIISSVEDRALPKYNCHDPFAKPQKGSCWLGLSQKGQTLHWGALVHRKRNTPLSTSPPPHLIYSLARSSGFELGAPITDGLNSTNPLLGERTHISSAVSYSLPCYKVSIICILLLLSPLKMHK